MVQLTRIYTRGGDQGKTSLGNGDRVYKHDPRIEVIGAVDEINAHMGVIRLHLPDFLDRSIMAIQHDLFDVGADLCMPTEMEERPPLRIQQEHIDRLEKEIDQWNGQLQPLTSFVLPGGSPASAYLHLARTVTRRAERHLSQLHLEVSLNPLLIKYINRLSDHLFVMARFVNHQTTGDVLWVPGFNLSEKRHP